MGLGGEVFTFTYMHTKTWPCFLGSSIWGGACDHVCWHVNRIVLCCHNFKI